ncbi:MAG: serine/threonine-protein kinase, partial [Myxococcota bacterium]|nr:serine/threonine-protein kinase [Myxococcota bacterium]
MVTTQPELPERYRLWPDRARALLGRGGAGEVWRAQDQDLGVLVALKILRAKGAKLRTRLEREAALAARVVHPNVVSVHDMGRTRDDLPYLAFALASHGSMLELAANPPPWTELRPLLVQLLDALAALHARGVLHLDVKLSNLLLHRTGPQQVQLWLADLGVARALYGDEDDDQGVVGTVGYMAAERLVGKHHLWTPATDLFSVGAVAYRILCGKLPFSARNATEALAARQSPPIELPVRPGYAVPRGLEQVILPLLNPNRLARFDLAADVARALLALEDVPSLTPGPSLQVILDTPTDVLTNPVGFRPGPNVNGVPEWNRPRPTPPPSQVPQLHQPRRVPLAPTLLVHREIPMVGRNEALDQAWALSRKVIHDHQPLILHIRGARGAGRTRFVQELIRSLEQGGLGEGLLLEYAVREGPSLGLRGAWHRIAPPHDNPESQVRELAYLLARDQSATIASALPDAQVLARWISPMGGDLPANAVAQSMLVDHLAHRSWRGLSWLWFEDAHLASYDDDAWPILEMILDRRSPILVLVTTRDDQPTDRLIDLSNRHPDSVHELDLGPLDIDACTRLVRALLPLESDLAGRLAQHAHGSPRYLRELVLQWVRQGQLVRQHMGSGSDPVWTLAEGTPPPPKNRHEFAQQRLDHALEDDPSMLEPLLTVALAGRGTPERVVARVVGEKLNALILDGLVTLERGMPVLTPPELPETIRGWPREEGLEPWIHEHLAAAWALEGDDPAVLARVGAHRAAADLPERALDPLDRALRALRRSLPVPEVVRLALLTMDVTERTVGKESSAWAHAAMALADATWFMGDAQGARDLYAQVEVLELPHEDAV